MRRLTTIIYPVIEDWKEFTELREQHLTLQERCRTGGDESDRLDRSREAAVEKDKSAYADALLEGKGDPGQKHTQAHDKAALDKRREVEALRMAVHQIEDRMTTLLNDEGQARLDALNSRADGEREKGRELVMELATQVRAFQDAQVIADWLQRSLKNNHPVSFRVTTGTYGRVPGLRAPNGEDHVTATVLDALNDLLEPRVPVAPRQPGEHVPPHEQNWGEVGSALKSTTKGGPL